ncbi:MAG: adenylate/guanylate cyclase domain-containing protein, partial [Gemmataceae bacterium]
LVQKGNSFIAFKLANFLEDCQIENNPLGCFAKCYALTNQGFIEKAQLLLNHFVSTHDSEIESQVSRKLAGDLYGLLAKTYKIQGTYKNLNSACMDPEKILSAINFYKKAHAFISDGYAAVNIAFLYKLLNQDSLSKHFARMAFDSAKNQIDIESSISNAWTIAILAESSLLLGQIERSKLYYIKFRKMVMDCNNFGNWQSAFRQLNFILDSMDFEKEDISNFLKPLSVALVVGHRIDPPHEGIRRFPESMAEEVKKEIKNWLIREDIEFGFSSAASGADLLFVEALIEKGGRCNIILPVDVDQFKKASVLVCKSPRWEESFDRIIAKCQVEIIQQGQNHLSDTLIDFANNLTHGEALLFAKNHGFNLKKLAVWDGFQNDNIGGTYSVLKSWEKHGYNTDVIKISPYAALPATNLINYWPPIPDGRPKITPNKTIGLDEKITFLLFADVQGFSELDEIQVRYFVQSVLSAISISLAKYNSVRKKNTWGDGIFVAFDSIEDAGLFGLDLADIFINQSWKNPETLPKLAIRIALHAGPTFFCEDPITKNQNVIGTHVSHAARLEPSTTENTVYASKEFAIFSEALAVSSFAYEYVGPINWAKNYGTFPTYLIKRKSCQG